MKTEVSTVTTKGQLVIPSKLRRKYSIKEGLSGEPSALKALLEERKREREL